MTLAELTSRWLARADELAPYAPAAAEAFRRAAGELEAVAAAQGDVALTLGEAASESGFSAEHLRHLVSAGDIPNAGRRGAPRIKRKDLPRKPGAASSYDPAGDALRLVRGT